MGARLVAVMMVAIALVGPVQNLALAQQPSQAPQSQPTPSQPAQPQPELIQSKTQSQPPQQEPARGDADMYDIGAGAMTGLGMPLKAGVCGLAGVFGLFVFVITLGSGERASAAVVEEGCNQRWIVKGDDIRPEGSRHQRMRERYDGGVR